MAEVIVAVFYTGLVLCLMGVFCAACEWYDRRAGRDYGSVEDDA